jgi:hypothetical protein
VTYINNNDWRKTVAAHCEPDIGIWYKCQELPEIFEVVALDKTSDNIEIQYFSGEIEELDKEIWSQLPLLIEIPAPEDWSGPYEMNREDMVSYLDDTFHPEDWNSPLTYLEAESMDWDQHHVH